MLKLNKLSLSAIAIATLLLIPVSSTLAFMTMHGGGFGGGGFSHPGGFGGGFGGGGFNHIHVGGFGGGGGIYHAPEGFGGGFGGAGFVHAPVAAFGGSAPVGAYSTGAFNHPYVNGYGYGHYYNHGYNNLYSNGLFLGAVLFTVPYFYSSYYWDTSPYIYDSSYDYSDYDWIGAINGNVPADAIVYQYQNNAPLYYCRVDIGGNNYNGVLVPYDGCYINLSGQVARFTSYDVYVGED